MLTSSSFVKNLLKMGQDAPGTLILPESDDPRVIEAARLLLENRAVKHLFLFRNAAAEATLAAHADLIKWLDLRAPDLREKTAEHLTRMAAERQKPLKEADLKSMSGHPLDQSAYLLANGYADAVVSGCVYTTADVIRSALRGVGLAPGIKTLSGSFAMLKGADQRYIFADCGVVVEPTREQLCDIALESVKTFRSLFPQLTPRVAFLSFSTLGSAQHPAAEKMREACKLFQGACPSVAADGELQFDAAFDPQVGQRKAPKSPVAGQANCFIFPDLGAGNIAYKITQRLGGFEAYGPILQGTKQPFLDLSRGASATDILASGLIALQRGRQA